MPDYGNLKPDDVLTDVFTSVLKDQPGEEYGSVKAGSNAALLRALHELQKVDPAAVQYHLTRNELDGLDELRDAVEDRQKRPFPIDPSPDTVLSVPEDGSDGG